MLTILMMMSEDWNFVVFDAVNGHWRRSSLSFVELEVMVIDVFEYLTKIVA